MLLISHSSGSLSVRMCACSDSLRYRLPASVLCTLLLLSALMLEGLSSAATTGSSAGCVTCGMPRMEKSSEEKILIEIAKQQILSKLHMKERPNITQIVPRPALMTALRKLHSGRVRQDGTFDVENSLPNLRARDQAYEVVSFADKDDVNSDEVSPGLSFQFLQERGHSVQVLQSSLWLYVHAVDGPPHGSHVAVRIHQLGQGAANSTLLLQRSVEVQRAGWHTFPIASALQAFLDRGEGRLRLRAQCGESGQSLCDWARGSPSQDPTHQPFLVAQVRLRDDGSKHARSKRSLSCGEDVSVCCKKDFYIRFRDIQWQDWIIAPEGYQMNYCMGQCPQHLAGSPGIASSFHATVFSQLKANGMLTAVSSCCVPIQRRPLSMVYFNSEHSIIKKDVPDMIVESCGCT